MSTDARAPSPPLSSPGTGGSATETPLPTGKEIRAARRDLKRKQRSMAEANKEFHAIQREEHREKWKDPYGEKQ